MFVVEDAAQAQGSKYRGIYTEILEQLVQLAFSQQKL